MQFAQPLWILFGLFCCAALFFLLRGIEERRRRTLQQFASAQLLGRLTRHVSRGRRRLKQFMLIFGVLLLFVALARPQYGHKWVDVKRKGIDILFALDTSRSMLAEDTRPNRLQRARLGILDFVSQLEGDRIGLMPFAGSSYLMCPLTLDYDAFSNSLASVTTDIIPRGGTNLAGVIEDAGNVLKNDANHKILVLITDGENLEGDAVEAAVKAHEDNMTIYTVGVGTPGGELIPLSGPQVSGFVKDEQGNYVTSKLDEQTLTAIAETTSGIYMPLGNNGEGLQTIYQEKLQLIPKDELAERRHKVPLERFSWPLTAAIILLVLEYFIPERKTATPVHLPLWSRLRRPGNRKQPLVSIVFLMLFSAAMPRPAAASDAEKAYADEEYLKASELYSQALKEKPDDPKLHYNYGTTAYKNNLFDEAVGSFTQALNSDDLKLQQKAYYNRGNAHFQKGTESRQANSQATIKEWEQAIESYDAALTLNPDDTLASDNKRYVEEQLAELKEQLEQQNQQNQQKQNDQGQDNKQQQQQGDSGSENGQQESPADQPPQNTGAEKKNKQEAPDKKNNQERESSEQEEEQNTPEQQPAPANKQDESSDPEPPTDQKSGSAGQSSKEDERDMQRRKLGKMTREEAENLLNALKNEEGELNFVPAGGNNDPRRDW